MTYDVRCKEYDYLYIGETGRNAYTKVLKHLERIRKTSDESVFHRQNVENHGDSLTITTSDFNGCDRCIWRRCHHATDDRGPTNTTRPGPQDAQQARRVATCQPVTRRAGIVTR